MLEVGNVIQYKVDGNIVIAVITDVNFSCTYISSKVLFWENKPEARSYTWTDSVEILLKHQMKVLKNTCWNILYA